jgi:hypothetical protein
VRYSGRVSTPTPVVPDEALAALGDAERAALGLPALASGVANMLDTAVAYGEGRLGPGFQAREGLDDVLRQARGSLERLVLQAAGALYRLDAAERAVRGR